VGRKRLTRDEQREIVDAQECITQAQGGYPDLIRSQTRRISRHRGDRPDAAIQCCDGSEDFLDRWERHDVLAGLDLGDLHPGGAATPDLWFT
jgi:hypothetical protein